MTVHSRSVVMTITFTFFSVGHMMNCIDLKDKYGHKYRVEHDESYRAERGRDPWLLIIPCRHGHIYPYGGDLLGAATNCRGPVANRLKALPGVQVVQDGDDGINVTFRLEQFDVVAAVLKPRRRRRLSPEHKDKLVAAGAPFRKTAGCQNAGADGRRARTVGQAV